MSLTFSVPEQEFPPLPNLSSTTCTSEPLSVSVAPISNVTSPSLDETFAIDLPPMSQLDSSVLEALPQTMKDKILRGYAKLEQISTVTVPSIESGQTVGVQKSPARLAGLSPNSTEKRGRGRGRGRGRRRGRGRGRGRDSALYKSPQKQSGLRSASKGVSEISPGKQRRLFEDTKDEEDDVVGSGSVCDVVGPGPSQLTSDNGTQNAAVEDTTTTLKIVIDDQAHFLSEFRAYLKEWVHNSSAGPLDSDLEKVAAYFVELWRSDMEAVFIILRGFRRVVGKQRSASWCAAFNSILDTVQNCVFLDYNGTLPIEKISV